MNSITVLEQRLKVAAEKGCCHTFLADDCRTLVEALEKEKGYASAYEAEKWHYHGLAESEGERANLAEAKLEAAEKRGADMEVACELYAESKLAQIKLEAALEKARQRIAELEARTVKLPADREPETEVSGFDSREAYRAGWNARGQADREALAVAGVAVEGE